MQTAASTSEDTDLRAAETELAFAGLERLGTMLRAGELTARELTETYLARIERLDPDLNAFVSVRREAAVAEAERAQVRLRAGEQGPLLGIPVGVKDNLDIAGEVTGHGTSANESSASADSELVRRLRQAGAPMLGKTSLPELAMWAHVSRNEAHGSTRNPWDPQRCAGGSSSGTAAAVAAGLAPIGIGSDGGGSIRVPSAMCGLFGLKPSRGRISTAPASEHWHGLTVLGGLARSVEDSAMLLDALHASPAGAGEGAPLTGFAAAARREPGELRIAVSLKGTLPGVKAGPIARAAVAQTSELLGALGHRVDQRDPRYGQLLGDIMPRYLAGVAQDAATLEHPERLEARSQRMAAIGRRLQGRALRRALRREPQVARRIGAVFADHDALLTPVTAGQPEAAERWQGAGAARTFNGGGPFVAYTAVWNYLGWPAAAVPAGLDEEGMPTAVQIVGPAGSEALLLSLAAQIERARPWAHRRPEVH